MECSISDRYQLLSEIGSGGTGTVYLAEHKKLKVYRAVKCISKSSSMQPSPFLEASLLKNLKHPGIPVIYDIEEDAQFYYIIEEYIQGVPLSSYCRQEDALPWEDILDIGIQLCGILEYLHNQSPDPVVYLDLKPEHIIICDNQVKIIDFGQASYLPGNGKVRKLFATPEYAAPELLRFSEGGTAADIYGFGAILYSLLFHERYSTGTKDKFPRTSKNFKPVLPILRQCLAEDEGERFSSITDVKKQLTRLQKGVLAKNGTYPSTFEKQDSDRRFDSNIVLSESGPDAGTADPDVLSGYPRPHCGQIPSGLRKNGKRRFQNFDRKEMVNISIFTGCRQQNATAIGICGVTAGAGVTHLAVALANYAHSVLGVPAAIVDYSPDQELYQATSGKKQKEKLFRCFSGQDIQTLPVSGHYRALVLDFGTDFHTAGKWFPVCAQRIVLGSLAAWKSGYYERFLAVLEESGYPFGDLLFLCRSETPSILRRLKKEYGITILPEPFFLDPYRMKQKEFEFLQELVQSHNGHFS